MERIKIKYSFKSFIANGIGADVVRIIQLYHYCQVNGIELYLNENDDWLIANHGNWKSLFNSLRLSSDSTIPEVDEQLLRHVCNVMIPFDDMVSITEKLFIPQEKYSYSISSDSPYAVIHVRRGDKVKGRWKEGMFHELNEYYQHIREMYERKDIFVMSDSPDVAKEAKDNGFMVDESEKRRDGYVYKLYHREEIYTESDMDDELNIFFKNMELFRRATHLVGSNASYYYVLGQLICGKKGISLSGNQVYHNVW